MNRELNKKKEEYTNKRLIFSSSPFHLLVKLFNLQSNTRGGAQQSQAVTYTDTAAWERDNTVFLQTKEKWRSIDLRLQ